MDFNSIAKKLEQKAVELAQKNNPHNLGIDEVVYSNAQYIRAVGLASRSADLYAQRLVRLTWVLAAFTAVLIILTVFLITDARDQISSQNNIALNRQFFTQGNIEIINAIERSQPILLEHGGRFTSTSLDNYLGTFEVVQSSYEKGLLKEEDLCSSFSYYLELTGGNQEIKEYIMDQQKTNAGFFSGFLDLVDLVLRSEDQNCR